MSDSNITVESGISVVNVSNSINAVDINTSNNYSPQHTVVHVETITQSLTVQTPVTPVQIRGMVGLKGESGKPIEKQGVVLPFSTLVIDALPILSAHAAMWTVILTNVSAGLTRKSTIDALYNGIDVAYTQYAINGVAFANAQAVLENNAITLKITNPSPHTISVSAILLSSLLT